MYFSLLKLDVVFPKLASRATTEYMLCLEVVEVAPPGNYYCK